MATASLDEETTKKVLLQVEFYFSDSNLPRDDFLKKSINESEDGLVSLALICSFSRMRNHLSLGGNVKPDDVSEEMVKAVAETLRKSTVLKVSEDGKKIGRSTELLKPEEVVEQLDVRTIAASPLEHDVTHEDLQSFFAQYGKDFDAERGKMMEFENSRSCKGSDNKNSSSTNANYPKGLIVSFKLKHMSEGTSAEHNGIHEAIDDGDFCKTEKELVSTENAPEDSKHKASENVEEKPLDNVEKGSGEKDEKITEEGEEKHTEDAVDESEEKSPEGQDSEEKAAVGERPSAAINRDNKDIVLREDLKSLFQRFGTVKYIDYRMGADSGFIRFEEPEAAQKSRAAAVLVEGGLIVKNYFASLEAVTGEAEMEYWSKLRGSQERRRDSKGNQGRGGRNYRGGRRYDGKHTCSRENDSAVERPNKAQKVAAA